ncbi:copper homeostasis protein CutC (plasmid) [Fulvitalea axinellae]|uniref:PF03932 family protein CutC n=1 Tax=Fulvitalea axinellae TaxID=1182444 RepID=A0AAU9D5X5_9BACT|nr:copper homeostasis protein CutC [Fulvitalea axinellae]
MGHQKLIEICVYNTESARIAEASGADRVELCSGPLEGGTTPSAGLIADVRGNIGIGLYVIIRPRGGDFCYTESEFEIMKYDIQTAKNLGADGIVIGVLKADGTVDKARTKELVELAAPLPVTFHRAFDVARDPLKALEDVIDCGCVRILTSGQKATADLGADLIKRVNEQAAGRISIMPGSGVNPSNVADIVTRTDANECHFSAMELVDGLMEYRESEINMSSSGAIPENSLIRAAGEKVVDTRKILDELFSTAKAV